MSTYNLELSGEVNVDMFSKVMKAYNETCLIPDQPFTSIDIYLNTDGGEVYQGLAIHDIINEMGKKIVTRVICVGQVFSSGIFILMAAGCRAATPNSFLMIHYGETTNSSNNDIRHNKELIAIHTNICYDRSLVSKRKINSWNNQDTYFNAEEALEIGLIDEII